MAKKYLCHVGVCTRSFATSKGLQGHLRRKHLDLQQMEDSNFESVNLADLSKPASTKPPEMSQTASTPSSPEGYGFKLELDSDSDQSDIGNLSDHPERPLTRYAPHSPSEPPATPLPCVELSSTDSESDSNFDCPSTEEGNESTKLDGFTTISYKLGSQLSEQKTPEITEIGKEQNLFWHDVDLTDHKSLNGPGYSEKSVWSARTLHQIVREHSYSRIDSTEVSHSVVSCGVSKPVSSKPPYLLSNAPWGITRDPLTGKLQWVH